MRVAQLLWGFLFAGGTGILAWRAKSLSVSGAWAAALSGGLIFGLGGWPWTLLLLTFFVSSSLISRSFAARKESLGEKFAKGSQRDWGQVLANGGLAAMLVVVHAALPGQIWPWLAYAGALAAVTADTWATELGVLSASAPRLITTGKVVERGASGGITILGTAATIVGEALIGSLAGLLSEQIELLSGMMIVTAAGLAGSLFDSILGATIQGIYFCPRDNKMTEQHPIHRCGTPTTLVRGWMWLNNDLVNFISSVFGGSVAVVLWQLAV